MRKIKILIVLAFTAGILICGAFFPRFVAATQDTGINHGFYFAQIQSVQLEIREKMPGLGKLSLMQYRNMAILLTQEETSMTEEEVRAAAMDALAPYFDCELIPYFEDENFQCRPYMIQNPNDPQHYGIFWTCFFSQIGGRFVYLYIDDETGAIVDIQYAGEEQITYEESETKERMQLLCEVFFESLGITDYQEHAATVHANEVVDHEGMIGDTIQTAFLFEDAEYGEVKVEFYSFGSGFYSMFPES